MRELCMVEGRPERYNVQMYASRFLRLQVFCSVLRMELDRPALNYRPNGKYGGTVEPPCDFQRWTLALPLFTGLPP